MNSKEIFLIVLAIIVIITSIAFVVGKKRLVENNNIVSEENDDIFLENLEEDGSWGEIFDKMKASFNDVIQSTKDVDIFDYNKDLEMEIEKNLEDN